jgi:hypothetical protein
MKKIIIKNVEYNLPENWSECTLKQAIKVQEYELLEDEYKVLALLAGYANIDFDTLKHFTLPELKELSDAMPFILTALPEQPIADFKFMGEHYYTMESFLEAEAQDYFTTEAILQANQNNTFKALPELLAVMCKREGETLDSYNLKERALLFEDLPMDIANGLRLFFYAVGAMSQLRSQTYLNRDKIVQAKASELRSTLNMLDGTGWSGRLLKKTLHMYLKSLQKNWKKYSSGFPSEIKK